MSERRPLDTTALCDLFDAPGCRFPEDTFRCVGLKSLVCLKNQAYLHFIPAFRWNSHGAVWRYRQSDMTSSQLTSDIATVFFFVRSVCW